MKPYGSDVVNLRTQVAGFEQAVARFHAASKGQDASAAYASLFEALSWTASIDHRVGTLFAPDGIKQMPREAWPTRIGGAEIVPALRWVRNTVHHDWADALVLDRSGFSFPVTFPMTFFEWRWREVSALPPNRRTKGREEYVSLLAGQPARNTLTALSTTFSWVARSLEPESPAPVSS